MVTCLSVESLAAHVTVAGVAAEKSTPSVALPLIVATVAVAGCVAFPMRVTVKLTLPSFSRTDAVDSFQPTRTPALLAASSAPRASSKPTPQIAVLQSLPAGNARAPARIAKRV